VPHLELAQINKKFGETHAVRDLNLHVERGEILSILGPSGCGKTTTLRMIAGLEAPNSGTILSNQRDITKLPARSRNMGMVFQNYALFPHLDVFENIAFGLKTRRVPAAQLQSRVRKALAAVRMQDYEHRSVHQLSGGQQQRVALARALAIEPEVLLLDEPLSNLDPSLREDLREQIRTIIRDLAVTTVFVTHDQQEAFALADRVAIMAHGVCHQLGRPEEVYNRPVDSFVAGFLGKANLLPGTLMGLQDDVVVMVRPENVVISLLPPQGGGGKSFLAIIKRRVFEGAIINYTAEVNGIPITAQHFHSGQPSFEIGETVQLTVPSDHLHIIKKP
jgi:iron(III) transport system ATP-binding protein